MKKALILLLCAVMLTGCGNSTSQEVTTDGQQFVITYDDFKDRLNQYLSKSDRGLKTITEFKEGEVSDNTVKPPKNYMTYEAELAKGLELELRCIRGSENISSVSLTLMPGSYNNVEGFTESAANIIRVFAGDEERAITIFNELAPNRQISQTVYRGISYQLHSDTMLFLVRPE